MVRRIGNRWLLILVLCSSLFLVLPTAFGAGEQRVFLPIVIGISDTTTPPPPAANADWLTIVNYYRTQAGVPPVTGNNQLSAQCVEHARYMAENNELTHNQNPNKPFASPAGALCGTNGNTWLGSPSSRPFWLANRPFESWINSIGHRLWMLYPTTPTFGYGFYTAQNNAAGGALDVLSEANFSADQGYPSWPIRYPAPAQGQLPATTVPVTINWRYFGATPQVTSTSWTTASGTPIAHTTTTNLPAGHKGIALQPQASLPNNTVFRVTVQGSYNNQPFSYSWQFATGSAQP
jgi:hypothetical protein